MWMWMSYQQSSQIIWLVDWWNIFNTFYISHTNFLLNEIWSSQVHDSLIFLDVEMVKAKYIAEANTFVF